MERFMMFLKRIWNPLVLLCCKSGTFYSTNIDCRTGKAAGGDLAGGKGDGMRTAIEVDDIVGGIISGDPKRD
jgi:hypothetical protein